MTFISNVKITLKEEYWYCNYLNWKAKMSQFPSDMFYKILQCVMRPAKSYCKLQQIWKDTYFYNNFSSIIHKFELCLMSKQNKT